MVGSTDNIQTRYRGFLVKFHGPGHKRGSRYSITDLRQGTRKMVGLKDEGGVSYDQACDYLESIGIKVSALLLCDRVLPEVTLLSTDFATPLK